MQRIVVDGYNLLFREDPDGRTLAEAREDLVRRIDAVRRAGQQVIVVFDGRPGPGKREPRPEGLDVRFASSPRTADDLIVKLVGQTPRNQTRVLTRDRELAARVKSAGGVVGDPEDALRPPRRRRSGPVKGDPSGKPPAPQGPELDDWERLFRERD